MLAEILPLLIILGVVVGAAMGVGLVRWAQRHDRTPADDERDRDEIAKRAARRAVNEALTRLR